MWSCRVRRAALAAICLGLAWSALGAELEERVFELRHRVVRDAAAVVAPLLSPDGTMLLQPRQNSFTVRDHPEVLDRVAATISRWDSQLAAFRLRVSLLWAFESGPGFDQRDPLLAEVSSGLTKLFGYHSCAVIDTIWLTGEDGKVVESQAGGGRFWVRFEVNAVPDNLNRVRLQRFEVMQREGTETRPEVRPLLTTASINLALGQTAILGLSRGERAPQALIVVLVAEPGGAP
ncbi:MAG TPA: secretin N-terminal domain-containing protein [Solirubrobacteraceae bacterium]|nr:secretin N-terminal domain-containing protein [Solirubrobacteraceae bacterium]